MDQVSSDYDLLSLSLLDESTDPLKISKIIPFWDGDSIRAKAGGFAQVKIRDDYGA